MTSKTKAAADTPKPVEELKDAKTRKRLDKLCREYRELSDEKSALESAQKGLKAEIHELVKLPELNRVKAIAGEGWLLTKVAGRVSEKILDYRLLERGVPKEVIEYATEVKVGEDYFVVKSR